MQQSSTEIKEEQTQMKLRVNPQGMEHETVISPWFMRKPKSVFESETRMFSGTLK